MNGITSEIAASGGRTTIIARTERQAMDWSLVLASQDIAATIIAFPEQRNWGLEINAGEEVRALDAIRRFRLENRGWQISKTLSEGTELRFHTGAIVWCLFLAAVHGLSGRWPHIIDAGNMDSAKVMAGQWWRLITAVTLHADLAHLLGNVSFGLIMLALGMPRFGWGRTLLFTFFAGVTGNVAGLILYPTPYLGVGASGMMMGALGLLAVHSVDRWRRHPRTFRLLWSGAGAAILIFVLFGMNPKTDIVAHGTGFVVGALLGAIADYFPKLRAQKPWIDWLAFSLLMFTIGAAWFLALPRFVN